MPSMGRVLALLALLALECQAWNEWTWAGDGPGPRAGHSMVLINDTIFLFGGRSNDISVEHVPRTYEVSEENGQLSFATYDQNLVRTCDGNVTFEECYNVTVGLLYNDMWSYNLGESCRNAAHALLVTLGTRIVSALVAPRFRALGHHLQAALGGRI
jgi:hypothetical protein